MQFNKNKLDNSKQPLIQQLLTIDKRCLHKTTLTLSIVGAGGKTQLSYWLANFFKQLGHHVCITTTTKMYLPDKLCIAKQGIDNIIELAEDNFDIARVSTHLSSQPSITFLYKHKLNNNIAKQVKVKGLSAPVLKNIQHSLLFDVLIVEADGANHHPIKAPATHEPCIAQGSNIVIGVTGAEAIFSEANSNNIHRWPQFSTLTHCSSEMQIDHKVLKRLLESPQGMFKDAPADALKIWVINKCDLSTDVDALLPLADRLLNELPHLKSIWLTQLNSPTAIKKVLIDL